MKLRHLLEAALLYSLYGFFRILPVDAASTAGGAMLGFIGPKLGASKKAFRNLELALPELDLEQRQAIVNGMWNNLGRIMAEYAHLDAFDASRVEVVNAHYLREIVDANRPVIVISGHFANWEILPVTAAKYGLAMQLIYRHANNPFAEKLLRRLREKAGGKLARKGVEGARSAHGALRDNKGVGMLIDQKHNRGLAIPLFGRPAMTGHAYAELAMRYNAPLVPIYIERLQGARFRITLEEPRTYPAGTPPEDILLHYNQWLERCIRQNPAQWLWLHRRW